MRKQAGNKERERRGNQNECVMERAKTGLADGTTYISLFSATYHLLPGLAWLPIQSLLALAIAWADKTSDLSRILSESGRVSFGVCLL